MKRVKWAGLVGAQAALACLVIVSMLVSAGCSREAGEDESAAAGDTAVDEATIDEGHDETKVEAGEPAPDFALPSSTGETVHLAELRGQPVVLYFYPKDDTPGCTTQACGFRDVMGEIEEAGAQVVGVSLDDTQSHREFKEKYSLNFPLLADTSGSVAALYGVLEQMERGDETFTYARRTTFLIDSGGTVRRVFDDVDPAGHADEVLEAIRAL
jgi:peroxiredoxin Q/BCP